jgi:heptosyltransferase-3
MLKILVIRACAIGDFVLNLPALVALQKTHPRATFTLIGNSAGLELAREFITVDRIYSIDLQPWSRLFYEPLPDLDFDCAIVWMKDPAVANNVRVSGIPNVVHAGAFPASGHAADHLLRTLGLRRPVLPDLWTPTRSDIVMHTGSGSPKKNWPFFNELLHALPNGRILPQDLSLVELSRYLRTIRAFIGNDSGITHLAAYLGCPTIALFGPTDPRIWGPIGRRSRVIWKTKLEDISVNEVLTAIHHAQHYGTDSRTRVDG